MKLLTYYLLIILPIGFIVWSSSLGSLYFVIALLGYCLVYRTIVDGERLVHLGLIKRSEIWKLLIPFYSIRYFQDMYFKNK